MTEPRSSQAVDWEGAYRELERTLGDMLTGVAAQMREMTTLRILGVHFLGGGDWLRIAVETSHNAKIRFEVTSGGEVVAKQAESFSNTISLRRPAGPYTVRAWARRPDSKRIVSTKREVLP